MSWTDPTLWKDTLELAKLFFVDTGIIYVVAVFYTVLFWVMVAEHKRKKREKTYQWNTPKR